MVIDYFIEKVSQVGNINLMDDDQLTMYIK